MKRLFLLLLTVALVPVSRARISANDPAESHSYEIVDWLEAYDCALPTVRSLRPLGHASLRGGLVLPKGHPPCQAPEWLMQERQIVGRPAIQNDADARVFLVHNDTIPLLGTESVVTPLYALRQGRPTFNGPNVFLEFNANGETGKDFGIAGSATPGWVGALDDYRSGEGRFYLQEGYLKVGYKEVALTWGREALRFGNAAHGSLLLSGATKPLDLWRFSVQPHEVIQGLGSFAFDSWIAGEGDSQFVQGARLWGTELGWRPIDWLELSFLELYQYGGAGAPTLTTSDYLKMLYYSSDSQLDPKRNRNFAGNVSVWLPDHFTQIYSQFLFSSLGNASDWLSQDMSVLAGIWFPKPWDGGDVRLEYVHTVPEAYRHPFWRQGLTYANTPLGHPLGPDAEGAYLDFGLPTVDEWRPLLGLFYESRARHPGPGFSTEFRYGAELAATARWGKLQLSMGGKYAHVINFLYKADNPRETAAFLGTLRYSFL